MTPVEGPTIAERMLSFQRSKWTWLALFYMASTTVALMAGLERGKEIQKIEDLYPYPQMYQAYMLDDTTTQLWSANVHITNNSTGKQIELFMPVEKDSMLCVTNFRQVGDLLDSSNLSWKIFVCRWPYQHYK